MKKLLEKLKNNDGFTLKNGQPVRYKSGYSVGLEGYECKTIEECIQIIEKLGGYCGIWFYNGIYYIDKIAQISTKRDAMQIGRLNNQLSIYDWKRETVLFLEEN